MEYRGATHICTGKHDQKNEKDIHENAKAKLSVCCLQELCRLNNNSVIITNKQNNFNNNNKNTNSTGSAMQLKSNTELVSPLK